MANLKAVSILAQTKIPGLVWGPPGSGKTSAIAAMAESMGLTMEVVIASIRDPSDFGGLPIIDGLGVRLAPPSWAVRLAALNGHEPATATLSAATLGTPVRGCLFIDEISTAPPAVQAALLRVVLDRVVGDQPLPACVSILAAANPPGQAAGGWELSAPLANRFVHLDWEVDLTSWSKGFLGGWESGSYARLPAGWTDGIPAQREIVASFLRSRPELLLAVPKAEAAQGRAWPSPRTWDMAATLMAACAAVGADEGTISSLVCGCVGSGPGIELATYAERMDLPNPEDLLAEPSSTVIPDEGDRQYALFSSVASAAIRNLTTQRWAAAWEVLAIGARAGLADVAASAATRLAEKNTDFHLPTPREQVRAFIPILRAAGLMRGAK